jgi:hypothetical protein
MALAGNLRAQAMAVSQQSSFNSLTLPRTLRHSETGTSSTYSRALETGDSQKNFRLDLKPPAFMTQRESLDGDPVSIISVSQSQEISSRSLAVAPRKSSSSKKQENLDSFKKQENLDKVDEDDALFMPYTSARGTKSPVRTSRLPSLF